MYLPSGPFSNSAKGSRASVIVIHFYAESFID